MIQFFLFPVSELTSGGATATAGFGRANTMGDFLLMMVGIMVGLVSYAKNSKQYLIYSMMLIFFALSLIMTKSRGAYISVPPVLFVIFAASKNKKAIMFLLIAAIFAGLYFFIINLGGKNVSLLMNKHHEEISEQFTQIGDVMAEGVEVDPSLNSRVKSWEASIEQIIDYPIFGQGCGAKRLGYSDNQYVRELLETGVIGFLVFLYMNLSIFLFMYSIFRKTLDPFLRSLALGFMGGQTGMMVHGVTMSNFYTIFNMEIFWFILAIICLLWYNENKRAVDAVQAGEIEAQ
jgi:O-antigen ligase